MDKNQAIIDYLLTCPEILHSPLYFNFTNAKPDNKQIVTLTTDRSIHREYVDGTVLKRFSFSIIDFRSMTPHPIVKESGYPNENVEEMLDVQSIIDWVDTQNDLRNFPNFGEDCVIDSIHAVTDVPALNGVDNNISPPLAKYSITIQVIYLDISKMIWNA